MKEIPLCRGLLYAWVLLALPVLLHAQQRPAGVVTALQGSAQLSRQALPAPTLLRFKDEILVRDVIDTREKSLARVLFGGKSTVTVRELTRLEVREEALPGGAARSIHELSNGAILVHVSKQLMRPGDEVQIRTPNAVAAVRGTTLYVHCDAATARCVFACLAGSFTLTPQGEPALTLTANNEASVTGDAASGIQVSPIQTVSAAQAAHLMQQFESAPAITQDAIQQNAANQVQQATQLATAMVEVLTGASPTADSQVQELAQASVQQVEDAGLEAVGPATPASLIQWPNLDLGGAIPPAGGCATAGNVVKNCSFEIAGSIPDWKTAGAVSTITAMRDADGNIHFAPTDGDRMAILAAGRGPLEALSANTVNVPISTLGQGTTGLQPGQVYLVTFDYNFMVNGPPTPFTRVDDTFQATIAGDGKPIVLAEESRNTSKLESAKQDITSSGGSDANFPGYTLEAGGGYTGWKTASKTIVPDSNAGALEFTIFTFQEIFGDSAVLIDNVSIDLDPPLFLVVNGQSLAGPDRRPLVEYSDQSVTVDSVLVASGGRPDGAPSVTLSGPLLKAQRSELNVPFSLLGLLDGSRLVSTSNEPLIDLRGGSYSLSTRRGAAIFDFWGSETAPDPRSGVEVGSAPALTHGRPLLQASEGAAVNTEKVLKLDTALLEATMPIISLIGSATAHTSLRIESGALDLIKSKLTSAGPVIALDKGLINVNNGPLINLTSGSQLNVAGDLLRLFNGSKINVVNGPLISVAGQGSLLDVGGALVNFGGSGGNKIIVNNAIAPTATLSGLPVSAAGGGSIGIGPTPVKNPGLGSISVTGSLIHATNGGKVNITAQ